MVKKQQTRKMVVGKIDQSRDFGFVTDQFTIETNKTLLKNKMMTFSAKVARQIGYTEGTMTLTLVWEGRRMSVRFVRDTHPGGGWRSVKEDFKKFFDVVEFKANQGYDVYQVPGLGQYAFEFEKAWEYFPDGGTVTIPLGRQSWQSTGPEGAEDKAKDQVIRGASSSPKAGDEIVWRRSVAAKKSVGTSVGQVKKKKPHMRVREPESIQMRKERSKVVYGNVMRQPKPGKRKRMQDGGSEKGKGKKDEEEEDLLVIEIQKEQEDVEEAG